MFTRTLPFSTYAPNTPMPGTGYVTPVQMIEDFVDERIEDGLVHTIHVSERRAFRNCRQRWQWAYEEDLHSNESIRALEFGSAYHHAMEKFYDPETWHLDKNVLAEYAIAEFKRYTEDTRDRFRNAGVATDRLEEDFLDRMTSGDEMLRHYFTEVAPISDTFEPVKVEIAFEVPLLDPDGNYILCKCDRCWKRYYTYKSDLDRGDARWVGVPAGEQADRFRESRWAGLPVTIGGRLDLLGRDIETGELGVLDWKTAATLMKDSELDFLELDDQISTYLLAMHKLGVPARQFWYHEQRKASPQRPEPLTRKYKGRLYQAGKDLPTSYELYLETIEEGDPAGLAAGAYTEYLDWLKTEGPKFWQRATLRRNDTQLLATERAIYFEYLDMLGGGIYISPEKKRCAWCSFFDPCLSKQRGAPYQHALKTLYVKGRPELSNDKNQPKKALPKREPGKAAEQVDQEAQDAGAAPRKDAK